jgi:hypothetical protein
VALIFAVARAHERHWRGCEETTGSRREVLIR